MIIVSSNIQYHKNKKNIKLKHAVHLISFVLQWAISYLERLLAIC
jgi:hypothetical protein